MKDHPVLAVLAIPFALLFFLTPLANIAYFFLVTGFVPSPAIRPVGDITAPIAGIILTSVLFPSTLKDIRDTWSRKLKFQSLQHIGLLIFAPFFGTAIWYSFLAGPLSYFLHQTSSVQANMASENVIYADFHGGTGCKYRAVLDGDRFLWQRQACGISEEAVQILRNGGRILLSGSVSKYGTHFNQYTIEAASR